MNPSKIRYERLYAGQEVELRRTAGEATPLCCVAFASYFNSGKPRAFGSTFFAKAGIAAYYVVPTSNNWYQTAEMQPLIEALLAHAGGRPLLGYGSSMGGFAALAYARALNLKSVIALSPQVAVSDALVGDFETRWRREAALLIDHQPDAREGLHPALSGIVAYDPLHRGDRRHAEMILGVSGHQLSALRVPCAAHPVGRALAANSVLSGLVKAIINGEPAEAATAAARAAYRSSPARATFTVSRFVKRRQRRQQPSPWAEALKARYGFVDQPKRRPGKATPAAVGSGSARPAVPLNRLIREVVELLDAGNAAQALAQLEPLSQAHPDHPRIGKLLQRARRRAAPGSRR
ncbi:MAG TPA: hypothetical protein VFV27_00010 [Nevskiaceae bacterium]|nr:hypothetical protein [Nevskiaceae bacterium]